MVIKKKLQVIFIIIMFLLTTCSGVLSKQTGEINLDNYSISIIETNNKEVKNFDFPPHWNWMDLDGVDWTTPAKHQKRVPSCFFFSIVGALESVVKIKEECADFNPDLSEQYIISCLFMKENISLFEDFNGTVFESSFPYEASFNVPCSKISPDWRKYFVPSSSINYTIGATKEFIKDKLINNGPLLLAIECLGPLWRWTPIIGGYFGIWGKLHRSANDYFSRTLPKFLRGGHYVTLVGWKDDPKIENGGYWICKNCWGTDWGYNGFFNIEYDKLSTNLGSICWVEYDPDDFNWPPIGSPKLIGPDYMDANIEYQFNISSIDPEGDDIFYNVSWGDGTHSCWIGPYESGSVINIFHSYAKKGSYCVKFMTKNEFGPESDWMPVTKTKEKRNFI